MKYSALFDAGFTDLISITPPGATPSERSKLRPESMGKVPGRRNASGSWAGYDWLKHETTRGDCIRWKKDGANLGLRTAYFPALDIDVLSPKLAAWIEEQAIEILGDAPVRIGRAPKKLLLYRTSVPFGRMRLWFRRPGKKQHLIEFLGAGQQAVVAGTHPGTMQPYTWDTSLVDLGAEGLTEIGVEEADAFLSEIAVALQEAGYEVDREGTAQEATQRQIVSQNLLSAPSSRVRAAVAAIPNTVALFPARSDYLNMGYAIKAALPEDPEEAFEIWWSWCERYELDTNTRENAKDDWNRMRPPFAIGAPWLFDQARQAGFNDAVSDFAADPIPLEAPPERERPPNTSGAVPYSDAWLARRCLDAYGNRVRWCPGLGGWLYWEGHRWKKDDTGVVAAWFGRELRLAGREALESMKKAKDADAAAWRCGQQAVRAAVMQYAATDPSIAVEIQQFDANPWALNTPGGVVDLHTGQLLPSNPGFMFTRCTSVAPDTVTKPRRWLAFLEDATGGDAELISYLQRLAGYCLTGNTREHVLAFLYGSGGNGKGTFLNTLLRIFGSYAEVAAMDTFVASRYDRHPTELAALVGARLVTAQETQEGRSWDEAKVKSITGGDPISARFMRQDFFRYLPQFKLVFSGNHRPRIMNLDDAMRRRFHLVPFTVKPPVVDLDLPERLKEEDAAILGWAIEGVLAWQQQGLNPPLSVRQATEDYFADEDPLGRWLDECCDITDAPGAGTVTRDLFASWRIWCGERNERVGTERTFSQALALRGFERWRHGTTRRMGYAGVVLAPHAMGPTATEDFGDIDLAPRPKERPKHSFLH